MEMKKTNSIPSLDSDPPLPERFGSREIEALKLKADAAACIVCEFSDDGVSSCCGADCPVRFHEQCLTPEFGGSEDLSNPFCPYCWLQVVSRESDSLREEAVRAGKAASEFLEKGIKERDLVVSSSKEVHFDNYSHHQPEDAGTGGMEHEEDNVIEDDHIETSSESEQGAVAAQPNPLRNFDKDERKRILWTPEEEAMLRMGVEKFSGEINKNMPWKKILKMGHNVFQQTRAPAHLKDKWRCMTDTSR